MPLCFVECIFKSFFINMYFYLLFCCQLSPKVKVFWVSSESIYCENGYLGFLGKDNNEVTSLMLAIIGWP